MEMKIMEFLNMAAHSRVMELVVLVIVIREPGLTGQSGK